MTNRHQRRVLAKLGPLRSSEVSIRKRLSTSAVALLSSLALVAATCATPTFGGRPSPGRRENQLIGTLAFHEGIEVNAIGGNLRITRELIEVDSDALISFPVRVTFNSSAEEQQRGYRGSGKWMFNFQMHFDGDVFVDDTGARHDVSELAHGDPIGGTSWDYYESGGNPGVRSKTGLVHRFDANGRLERIDGPESARLLFAKVPGTGRIGTIEACVTSYQCELLYTISYDGKKPATIGDEHGRAAALHWQGDALTAITSPQGFTTTFEYEGALVSALVTHESRRTEFEYTGERIEVVRQQSEDMESPVDGFFYSGAGPGLHATEWTDALGVKKRYVYDGEGRLLRIENADASVTFASWQWTGQRPSASTDRAGLSYQMTWENDSLTRLVTPSGNVVGFEYAEPGAFNAPVDLDGRPIGSRGPRALARAWDSLCPGGSCVEENVYDEYGRLVSIANGEGEATTFMYQGGLRIGRIARPWGESTEFTSFRAGHAMRAKPNFIHMGFLKQQKQISPVGDTEAGASFHLPRLGGRKAQAWNLDRMLTSMDFEKASDPTVECTIEVTRRSDGLAEYVDRPCGADHELSYNDLGWLESRREEGVEGWLPPWTFERDSKGRLTKVVDPTGANRDYTYTDEGELESISTYYYEWLGVDVEQWVYEDGRKKEYWTDESLQQGTPKETYSYHPQGVPGAGKVSRVEFDDGTSTELYYDVRGRLTLKRFVRADGSVLRELGYAYDLADRVTEELDGGALLVRRTFEDGRLAVRETGDGLTRTLSYGEPPSIETETRDASGALVEQSTFSTVVEYPPEVAIESYVWTSSTTTWWNGQPRTTTEVSAIEDGLLRESSLDSELGPMSWSWDFGVLGDIEDEGPGPLQYDDKNSRLLLAAPMGWQLVSYLYDDAGRAVRRGSRYIAWTTGGCMRSHGQDTFEWSASCSRLFSKTVDGTTTSYLYGGEVEEVDGMLRVRTRHYILDLETGHHLYLHADSRGNTSFVTQAGEVKAHYAYSPYRLEVVYGASENDVTFAGRVEIGELMLLGDRVYDPAAGRFLSQDPVFQLVNQYTYTNGNPIWWQDRNGLYMGAADVLELEGQAAIAGGSMVLAVGGVVGAGVVVMSAGVALVVVGGILVIAVAVDDLSEQGGSVMDPNSPEADSKRYRDKSRCTPSAPPSGWGPAGPPTGMPDVPTFDLPAININFNIDLA